VFLATTRSIRQFPLYSKKEPPAMLTAHFTPEVFEKSQKYGRDKAKFSLVSGFYKQCLDSTILHLGFYAWSWTIAGKLMSWAGYGPKYEVRPSVSISNG
jgi:STE24 endopeptidase